MKIEYVLTAVNVNPLYIDFIPNFVKHWSFLFPEIKIKIILIADEIPQKFIEFKKHIELFKPIDNIPTAFQAMCIRNLFPALVDCNDGVIITDIDMMPMNRDYYERPIQEFNNDTFITYRDVLVNIKEYPMCYNIATPNIWKKVFNIYNMTDLINMLTNWYNSSDYPRRNPSLTGIHPFDQKILFQKLQEFNSETGKLIVLNDDICKYKRLDRIHKLFGSNKKFLFDENVQNLEYHDYHSMRPYNKYKYHNDTILHSLLKSKK
jgi:hypothetical protein